MNERLDSVIKVHGGLDRWNAFDSVTATILGGGGMWAMKGIDQEAQPREIRASLHKEVACVTSFGNAEWRMSFTPERIAIESHQERS